MVDLICVQCGSPFTVRNYRRKSAKCCSKACSARLNYRAGLGKCDRSHLIGNRFAAGRVNRTAFPKGNIPWNAGVKGIHCSPASEFKRGHRGARTADVGTVRISMDHGHQRARVKVAEPNRWKLRAVVVWEAAHGPLPRGKLVHHRNRDTLDDSLENLQAMTRAEHIKEHRSELLAAREAIAAEVELSTLQARRAGQVALFGREVA